VAAEIDARGYVEEAASELEEIGAGIDRNLYKALAATGRAWAHVLANKPEAASETARAAVGLLGKSAYRPFHARALDVLGRSLLSTDRHAAADALGKAAAIFAECGAVQRRQRSLEVLRSLGQLGRRQAIASTGAGSLTPREREVVRLAEEGLSAREIGKRLFISERTVETHLANAYAKLGVSSRLELVRKAAELSTEPAQTIRTATEDKRSPSP
jgi:DNA-binding CsgD family transcriptional regulator